MLRVSRRIWQVFSGHDWQPPPECRDFTASITLTPEVSAPAITVLNVVKQFGRFAALRCVSAEFDAGRFHAILEHAGYRLGFVVLRTAGGRYRWEVLSVPDTAGCATFAEEMAQARCRGEALCAWSDAFPSSADDTCVQWDPAPAHRSTCHLGSHAGR